jgi:hypothetical protein
MKGRVYMFDKKYNKVLELLDKKIEITQMMFDKYLKESENNEGLTDDEIYKKCLLRNGTQDYVDKYLDKLEALCELKREIKEEIGRL